MNLQQQAERIKEASASLRNLSNEKRNTILHKYADKLIAETDTIIAENRKDLEKAAELSSAMKDRLTLTRERIQGIARGIEEIKDQSDPLGIILEEKTMKSGLHMKKVTRPIGVICIIFESRPNVAADCMALCLKSGNACFLKGGHESYHSCLILTNLMKEVLKEEDIPEDVVMLAENPTHEEMNGLMADRDHIDLLIPRGSKRLIKSVVEHAKVPVIETGAGVCHVYVDESADLDMAERIVINAKCSRPSVCNAMETLLVNETVAPVFLPRIAKALKEKNVLVHADEKARAIVPEFLEADENSWYTEYNDLEMNLKVVRDTEEAVHHIETYGTHHSESIVSEDPQSVKKFMNGIDSACLYHNASTRFTDGGEFGYGAEIGISTQKLHARGPMGLNALTTYTFYLEGNGEIR